MCWFLLIVASAIFLINHDSQRSIIEKLEARIDELEGRNPAEDVEVVV